MLQWDAICPPVPLWRLQPRALEDAPFRASLAIAVTEYFKINLGTTGSNCTEWEAFKVTIRGHCIGTQWNMRRHLDAQIARLEELLLKLETAAITDTQGQRQLLESHAEHEALLERLKSLNYASAICENTCQGR